MTVVNRFIQKLFSRPASIGSPYDGIVHSVAGKGHALPFAEQSAVARALNTIGYRDPDPHRLRAAVQRYTAWARQMAGQYPEHPLVRHYTDQAKLLNAPDVQGNSTSGYLTVPTTGPAGETLGHAAVPLIRFINRLMHQAGHEPLLTVPKPEQLPSLAPTVKPAIERPAQPSAPAPTIRPATSQTNRPIPLVDSPPANRWRDLDDLRASGADRTAMIDHLMNVHSTTRRQAADTIRRWARSKR